MLVCHIKEEVKVGIPEEVLNLLKHVHTQLWITRIRALFIMRVCWRKLAQPHMITINNAFVYIDNFLKEIDIVDYDHRKTWEYDEYIIGTTPWGYKGMIELEFGGNSVNIERIIGTIQARGITNLRRV